LIGLIQCSSTAACERGFNRLYLIKNKFRKRLKNNAIDALIRISIKGPKLEEHDFNASLLLWQESKAYCHIFTGTSHEHDDEIEDFIEDID
jgi:TnpA family transposase